MIPATTGGVARAETTGRVEQSCEQKTPLSGPDRPTLRKRKSGIWPDNIDSQLAPGRTFTVGLADPVASHSQNGLATIW